MSASHERSRPLRDDTLDPDWDWLLQRLLAFTQELNALAKSREWDQLAVPQQAREGIISALFQLPVPAEKALRLKNAIQQVQQLDQETADLLRNGRREIQEKLSTLKTGHQAVHAYGRNSH